MVQSVLKDIDNFDVYHELVRVRAVNVVIDKKLGEHARLLEEDNEIDDSYKILLLSVLNKGKKLESHNKRKDRDNNDKCNVLEVTGPERVESRCKRKNKDYMVYCSAKDKKDPNYELPLKHLKDYKKSFAHEYKKGGSSADLQYKPGIGLYKECNQECRKEYYTATMQKIGTSNEMPGAANELKQCQQAKSVKKTMGSPTDRLPDREQVPLHRNADCMVDCIAKDKKDPHYELPLKHLKGYNKSSTHEYKKIGSSADLQYKPGIGLYKECNQEYRKEYNTATMQKIGTSNAMPGAANQLKQCQQAKSVKKTMGSPTDRLPDPEQLPLHRNADCMVDCSAKDKKDPCYELPLKHLKGYNKSSAHEYKKVGSSVDLQCKPGIGLYKECNQECRKESNKATMQKIGTSNEMPGAANQLNQCQQSKSVKKTLGLPTYRLPDSEQLPLHRNAELKCDVCKRKSNTAANQKAHGMKGGNEEKVRKLSSVVRPQVELSNHMLGVQRKQRYNPEHPTVKKTNDVIPRTSRDEAKKIMSSPTDRLPDPEQLPLHGNAEFKCNVVMHKSNTSVNEKVHGMKGVNEEKVRKLSSVVRPQVKHLNCMPSVQIKQTHNPEQPTVKKTNDVIPRTSRDEAKMVENVRNSPNTVAPVPEYHHVHQNVKCGDDSSSYKHNAHNVVNKTCGVNHKIVKKRKLTSIINQIDGASDRIPGVENQCKGGLPPASVEMVDNVKGLPIHTVSAPAYKHQMVNLEDDYLISTPNCHTVVNEKLSRSNAQNVKGLPTHTVKDEDDYIVSPANGHTVVNGKISGLKAQRKQDRGKLSRDVRQKVGLSNEVAAEVTWHEHDLQPPTVKNTKNLTMRKSRNAAEKADVGKCSCSKYRNVKAAKNAMENKKVGEASIKEEPREETSSDVEILGTCDNEGILSPFTPSKNSCHDEKPGASTAHNAFRGQVLDFLRRPYDKEEYIQLREGIEAGSYLKHYPDLKKKLVKYRYKQGKLLTILRGFFYWLQNVTQQGAFKPWIDGECLAVEPEPPHA